MGNGHRVGNNNGNRNRTRGMRCEVERNGDQGLGFRMGIGAGNMKCVGEWDQEWGCEQISRNQGIMGQTEPGWRTVGGCVLDPKLGRSSEGDLVSAEPWVPFPGF